MHRDACVHRAREFYRLRLFLMLQGHRSACILIAPVRHDVMRRQRQQCLDDGENKRCCDRDTDVTDVSK